MGRHPRYIQHSEQRSGDQLTEQGNKDPAEHCDKHRCVYCLSDRFPVSAPDCVGDHNIRPECDPDKQVDDQTDDRAVCADSGDRYRFRFSREIPDDCHI